MFSLFFIFELRNQRRTNLSIGNNRLIVIGEMSLKINERQVWIFLPSFFRYVTRLLLLTQLASHFLVLLLIILYNSLNANVARPFSTAFH